MNTSTILLLLISVLIAVAVSFYQYFYKAKSRSKVTMLLAFLRFLSIFGLLLLLINPIITRKTIEVIKTPLPIILDNSASISELNANKQAKEVFEKLKNNSQLNQKFDVQTYQFDGQFSTADSINFKGKQTRIDHVATELKSIYKHQNHPSVLITDGNQTSGEEYAYSFDKEKKVYPVVVGDTTTFLDLKITRLNVNKYAFHKNKFPVEVFLNYAGTKSINATFKIAQGNSVLNEQTVAFSPSQKSATLNVLLPAEKVGLQIFKASITSKEQEKNSYNNVKNFAVEVMEQKTEVAFISTIPHPDLGALKRSIESNAQRKVTIVKPNEIKALNDYNVLILYQPNTAFKSVIEQNKNAKINTWIITGNATDFNFLNQYQDRFDFKMSTQKEDFLAQFNSQFNLFALENIGFEQFPPLENAYGKITPKGTINVLLSASIRGISAEQPLFAFEENQGNRNAFLFGENIWKWRAKSYLDTKSFEEFDQFIDKTIQFLTTNTTKKALVVNHERFYNSGDEIEIEAQYFNKNYELDQQARLTIQVINQKTKAIKKYDLTRSSNAFKVDLAGIDAGNYSFTVKELNSNASYSSTFEVLDFDIEKQFVNPNWKGLNQLAQVTNGKAYLTNQVDALIKQLQEDATYKDIQKEAIKKSPLIDWVWILILILVALTTEWFVRKYNGML